MEFEISRLLSGSIQIFKIMKPLDTIRCKKQRNKIKIELFNSKIKLAKKRSLFYFF